MGTAVNPTFHNYSYLYDKLNRLTNGTSDEGFNELINYDKMGNITSMNRNLVSTSSYSYDVNGSQTADSHKGITLAYNYLNLPQTINKAATSETMTKYLARHGCQDQENGWRDDA